MKIAIIGPSFPFRGGIAHYMTLLFKELAQHHEVRFLAFKRQYPKFLYPGKTDKDPSQQAISDERIEQVLDSCNPLSWFSVYSKVKQFNADIVIIPWWVAFWAPQFGLITRLLRWFTKTKILFICHNVVEHEANFITKFLTKSVLKKGDMFIVHSEDDRKNLKTMLPQANVKKSHQPTYDVFKLEETVQSNIKEKLGLGLRVILFFGFIREYKGLHYLLDAMPRIIERNQASLLIVGEFWKDKEAYLEQVRRLNIEKNVYIVDEYVPNEDVPNYFAAADIAVLPYTSATGRGIVQMALGLEKPVITTKVGSLAEVVRHEQTGYLIEPRNPQEIVKAVGAFYKRSNKEEFVKNIKATSHEFSWTRMREIIEELSSAEK